MWLYVDVFVIQNMMVNCFAIYLALQVTGARRIIWRIALAGLLGAVYALVVIITDNVIAKSVVTKVIVALAMIKAVTPNNNMVLYAQTVISFFIIAAVISGLLSFVSPQITRTYVLNDYFIVTDRSEWTLFFLLPFLLLIKWISKNYLVFKEWVSATSITVSASIGSKKLQVKTVLDTGNNLANTFNKAPVIVINREVLLEQGFGELYGTACQIQDYGMLSAEQERLWEKYGNIIPYQTVGSEVSILPAIKPDSIEYSYQNRLYRGSPAVIALAPNKFFNRPEIEGLLHPVVYKSIIIEAREGLQNGSTEVVKRML